MILGRMYFTAFVNKNVMKTKKGSFFDWKKKIIFFSSILVLFLSKILYNLYVEHKVAFLFIIKHVEWHFHESYEII